MSILSQSSPKGTLGTAKGFPTDLSTIKPIQAKEYSMDKYASMINEEAFIRGIVDTLTKLAAGGGMEGTIKPDWDNAATIERYAKYLSKSTPSPDPGGPKGKIVSEGVTAINNKPTNDSILNAFKGLGRLS